MARYTDYDALAWIYDRHWSHFPADAMPVLESLVLANLRQGAHVLDLCCGTGQLARLLTDRGYRVTGVDGSASMLDFARRNAPEAELLLADARSFTLPSRVDAVLSTYDSLNHVMSLEELGAVFRNVSAVLRDGGQFVFDLNMEEKYGSRWTATTAIIEEDYVCIVQGSYATEQKLARFDATVFVRRDAPSPAALHSAEGGGDEWQRSDATIWERCYAELEVRTALGDAGFVEIEGFDWRRDLEPTGEAGRTFFLCRKGGLRTED